MKAKSPLDEGPYSSFSQSYSFRGGSRSYKSFEHPASKVRRLAAVRGWANVLLPQKYETLTFEKPFVAVGQTRNVGVYTITLKTFERTADGILAEIRIESDWLNNEAQGSPLRVHLNKRLKREDIKLLDTEGMTHDSKLESGSGGESTTTGAGGVSVRKQHKEWRLIFPGKDTPKALRMRFMARTFEKRVEFEFKDVDLP